MQNPRSIVSRLLLCALALAAVPASPAHAVEASPYGVNIHAPQGEELTFLLNQVQAAGIGWVRIDFVWAYVETSKGVYDWSVYDAIAAAAQARGLEIFATLDYTPAWATSGPELSGVPSDPQTWVDFCFRAAQRYRGKIRYWGMWNEPNLTQFWSGSRQQYLDVILKPGADAIHAGNPDARVGGPELAHLTSGNADWYYWLQDTIDQAADKLDFVTHHVYDSGGSGNVTNDLTGSTLFATQPQFWTVQAPSVREVLKYTGWYPGKAVWLTETGWESSRVGEDRQASYYTGLLNDWLGGSGQTWIGKIFFYEIKDGSDPGSSTWGILRGDRTAKPAYTAYQSFIAQHQQAVDDALSVADTFPTTLDTGQSLDATLTFKNVGTTTWTSAAGYTLGAGNDADPFTDARQPLAAGDSIAPGQQKVFKIHLQTPLVPGIYTVRWSMLREGGNRFGTAFVKQITVNAAPSPASRSLALLSSRFTVEVTWHDQHSGRAGYGRAVPSTDQTGFFWFFDPSNIELVVKVLDGRPVNGAYWVFYGALSDVEYWVKVTDGATGKVKQYHNAPGSICGSADTQAFRPGAAAFETAETEAIPLQADVLSDPALPAASASGCVEDSQTLCLLNHRYRVSVAWHDQHNNVSGQGFAAPRTDQSGTFWFFDPRNVELVVKVLDGTLVNGKTWVFYGALSDVKYTITVVDTATGAKKQYLNKPGNICGKGDTAAF